jgi:GntR family transcriptional regulator
VARDPISGLRPPVPGGPAYRQIEEQLLDLIEGGVLAPGDRVPAERELAQSLGVSRMTLRHALDGLVRRGLLHRAGGRGTFVAQPKVDQDLRVLRTYPDELRRQGVAETTTLVRSTGVAAPVRVAAALGLARGVEVAEIERLRSAGGSPFVTETSWVPLGLVDVDQLTGSLWDALALAGRRVVRAVERLEPILAGLAESALLGVAVGAPLMRVERISYDQADRGVEFAVAVFRGDRARFIVEVSGAPEGPDPAH